MERNFHFPTNTNMVEFTMRFKSAVEPLDASATRGSTEVVVSSEVRVCHNAPPGPVIGLSGWIVAHVVVMSKKASLIQNSEVRKYGIEG